MEQNQEQKQEKKVSTLVQVAFYVGIAAAAFELLGWVVDIFWFFADLISLAGVVLAIIALIKKLEPKKNVFIGGGLSLLIFILAWSGYRSVASDDSFEFSSLSGSSWVYDDISYDYDVEYTTIKEKAVKFATRTYEADKKGDKDAIVKLSMELDAYTKDLSESDYALFMTYFNEHLEFLMKGTATELVTSDVEDIVSDATSKANDIYNSSVNAAKDIYNSSVKAAKEIYNSSLDDVDDAYEAAASAVKSSYEAASAAYEAAAAASAAAISDSWDW